MIAVAKAGHSRSSLADRHYDLAAHTVLAFSGAILTIAGLVLTAGGFLSALDGSAFYMLTGLALILSGLLIARRSRAGAWVYMAVFAATLSFSLRNIDTGSPLAFRLIGPALLLAILALLMPILCRWRPRHALIGFAVGMLVTSGVAIASTKHGPLASSPAAVTQFFDSQAKGVLQ